jgi:hypothetical protein
VVEWCGGEAKGGELGVGRCFIAKDGLTVGMVYVIGAREV